MINTQMRPPQGPIQQQISLEQTTGVNCANCGGIFFESSTIIRKVSRVLTGSPQDTVIMIPVNRCQDCGEVLREFFPEGMTDVEARLGLKKKEPINPEPQGIFFK